MLIGPPPGGKRHGPVQRRDEETEDFLRFSGLDLGSAGVTITPRGRLRMTAAQTQGVSKARRRQRVETRGSTSFRWLACNHATPPSHQSEFVGSAPNGTAVAWCATRPALERKTRDALGGTTGSRPTSCTDNQLTLPRMGNCSALAVVMGCARGERANSWKLERLGGTRRAGHSDWRWNFLPNESAARMAMRRVVQLLGLRRDTVSHSR